MTDPAEFAAQDKVAANPNSPASADLALVWRVWLRAIGAGLILGALMRLASWLTLLPWSMIGKANAAYFIASLKVEFEPITFIAIAWPLFLGVCLAPGRRMSLARAAGITGLALALDRLLALAIECGIASVLSSVFRPATNVPGASTSPPWMQALRICWNSLQLGLAFLIARASWRVHKAWIAAPSRSASASGSRRPRGLMLSRTAAVASFVFCFLILCGQGWAAYLDVLERYPSLSKLVLGNEQRRYFRLGPRNPASSAEFLKESEAIEQFNLALGNANAGRFREARNAYIRGLHEYAELLRSSPRSRSYRERIAYGSNNLAWMLATWPDPKLRDLEDALPLAERAVEFAEKEGNYWNTLGVVKFRIGQFDEARRDLEKSCRLRDGGDAFDWYFLAMLDHERGNAASARTWYDKAVEWGDQFLPGHDELHLFRTEAAASLGLPAPPAPREPDPNRLPMFSTKKRGILGGGGLAVP